MFDDFRHSSSIKKSDSRRTNWRSYLIDPINFCKESPAYCGKSSIVPSASSAISNVAISNPPSDQSILLNFSFPKLITVNNKS